MRSESIFRALLLGVLFLAIGCGSDGFDPSLPGSKPLDQLSTQEASKLCQEVVAYAKTAYPEARRVEEECRVAGLIAARDLALDSTAAQLQAACKEAYEACKVDPPPAPEAPDCSVARDEFTACSATVDQYAACLDERLADPIPSCTGLTRDIIFQESRNEAGPACAAYHATCETPL
jgi:hypothetical protein